VAWIAVNHNKRNTSQYRDKIIVDNTRSFSFCIREFWSCGKHMQSIHRAECACKFVYNTWMPTFYTYTNYSSSNHLTKDTACLTIFHSISFRRITHQYTPHWSDNFLLLCFVKPIQKKKKRKQQPYTLFGLHYIL